MRKNFITLIFLAALTPFVAACGAQSPQEHEQAVPEATSYQIILGKSLSDKDVAEFIVGNNCSSAGPFQVCKDAGMALWMDSNQVVKTVYMYSGNVDGFKRYRGKLPFGLTFYDPMWKVEEKLGELGAEDETQAAPGAGLPDEGRSPDHIHFWAVYKQLGLVVIYDSGIADPDAYIYAVLVSM